MKICSVFLLTGVFLAASCADVQTQKALPGSGTQTGDDFPSSPAVSLEDLYDSGYWVTAQSDAGITVMGIAGRRGNRTEAIAEALADAARRVALYYGVRGESASVLNEGSGNLDYFQDFDYKLDLLNNVENYVGALVFDKDKDILEKSGVVFVRTQYPGVSLPSYKSVVTEDGTPDWVKNYSINIPGYLTSVSFSKNRGSPQKTYQSSYESAIASLLPQLSTRMGNEVVDVSEGKLTYNYSVSSGILENVIILETWADKKTGAIWTLLVARQKL
jgi:hypothetical protein